MSMVCVPIMVEEANNALLDATLAQAKGADLVEFRVDLLFEQRDEESLEVRIARVLDLVKDSPLPCIVTCRPHWEGGDYHGDDDQRIALYLALGTSDHPPAYIDVELATYTRSANIRQKINLAVGHGLIRKLLRTSSTRLILSSHDFEGRPSDLTRKIIAMNDEPACSMVKIAYRARSIRDNLEVFEILRDRQKPTIALCMGEFGLMSRVLAPKFGGLLTFASLRDEEMTAPGQPTIDELLGLYRFRSIKATTKVYGIIGWPVMQSMSPLVHNAGFEKIGWDGVYVPMPVEGSYESFKATVLSLLDYPELNYAGASVTIPHKRNLTQFGSENGYSNFGKWSSMNTLRHESTDSSDSFMINTDQMGIRLTLDECGCLPKRKHSVGIVGAGGVAETAAEIFAYFSDSITIYNRTESKSEAIVKRIGKKTFISTPIDLESVEILDFDSTGNPIYKASVSGETQQRSVTITNAPLRDLIDSHANLYINCTPVGMTGGSDPDGLSIPIPDMPPLPPETVFFDTVYNPIETPMLKAAKERGYRTIDGVQMFVKQAEAQFELWTGQSAPEGLYDRLVREKLTQNTSE